MFIFEWIFIINAGTKDNYKSLDGFEFLLSLPTTELRETDLNKSGTYFCILFKCIVLCI